MSHAQDSADRIMNLWPTLFGHAVLPGCEQANSQLLALARSGAGGDLLARDEAPVHWLRAQATHAVQDWFAGAEMAEPGWRLGARLDRIGFCDYRDLGNEPGAFLSGLYFANEPAAPEIDGIRSDCDPSSVTFFDPRVGFNALALEGDPYFSQAFTVKPEPGMLMLWPAYVRHFVRVHLSHEPWVMVRLRVDLGATASAQVRS